MDSLMEQYTTQVMRVTATYITLGARWTNDLVQYQNSLDLGGIFHPQVFLSDIKRQEAKEKLDCIAKALEEHKKLYQTMMVNYNRDLLACASSLPEVNKAAIRETMIAKVQDHLREQAYFYELREHWIGAVRSLLAIFDNPNRRVHFDGEQFLFEDDDELEYFNRLAAEIDQVAAQEAALMEARLARMKGQGGVLGIHIE
jgi:hypothetical protein